MASITQVTSSDSNSYSASLPLESQESDSIPDNKVAAIAAQVLQAPEPIRPNTPVSFPNHEEVSHFEPSASFQIKIDKVGERTREPSIIDERSGVASEVSPEPADLNRKSDSFRYIQREASFVAPPNFALHASNPIPQTNVKQLKKEKKSCCSFFLSLFKR